MSVDAPRDIDANLPNVVSPSRNMVFGAGYSKSEMARQLPQPGVSRSLSGDFLAALRDVLPQEGPKLHEGLLSRV